jgi:hypothetical protein
MSEGLAPMYRMPVSFGPAPGPRNLPAEQRHRRYEKQTLTLTISARADGDALARMLPPGFAVAQPASIEVSLMVLSDVGWLAGRGYNILIVRIPARWKGQEEVSGHFVPVLWESMADPILTGREELGWPKIFADIEPSVVDNGAWRARASWEGFSFFEMSAGDWVEAAAPRAPPPMMFHKYLPRTGEWGEADIDQCTVTGPDGARPQVKSAMMGQGSFAFHRARWHDMPTQYAIVNALAALPLEASGPASLVETSGGGDASGQRRLR